MSVVWIQLKILTSTTGIGLIFNSTGFQSKFLGNELGLGMIWLNHELAISGVTGNLHNILLKELHSDNPDLTDVITCAIHLSSLIRVNSHNCPSLIDLIPTVFPQPCNHRLEAQFITEMLHLSIQHPTQPEQLIAQAISHFQHFTDPVLECEYSSAFVLPSSHTAPNVPS